MSFLRHLRAVSRLYRPWAPAQAPEPITPVVYAVAASAEVEHALHMASGAIAASLSLLEAKTHTLTTITEVALRQANRTASSVNQMVVDADQASDAVEELARCVTSIAPRPRSGKGDLRSDAAEASRLAFGITVQAIQSRTTTKQLAGSLDDIHRMAVEVQTLTEEVRRHLERLANQVGTLATHPPTPCNDECCRERA